MIEASFASFLLVLAGIGLAAATLQSKLFGLKGSFGSWILSLSISIVLTLMAGVVLVRSGVLTPLAVMMTSLGLAGAIHILFKWDPTHRPSQKNVPVTREDLLVITLGLISLSAFLPFPTYFLSGARDHGVYLIQSIVIAQSGALNFDLPLLGQPIEALRSDVRLSFPGFYSLAERGLHTDPNVMVPQFRPLAPILLAFGSWASGIEGIVRTNGIISSLCVPLMYLVARRYMPVTFSAGAALALLVNASFIWIGRSTFSEPLTILINLVVLALLTLAHPQSRMVAVIAGTIAAAAAFNRLDGAFTGLILAGNLLHAVVWNKERLSAARIAMIVFVVVTVIAYAEGAVFGLPYLKDHQSQVTMLLVMVALLAAMVVCAPVLCDSIDRFGWDALRLVCNSLTAAAFLLTAWIVYRFVTAIMPAPSFAERSFLEMGWYLSYPVILTLPATLLMVNRPRKTTIEFICLIGLAAAAIFVAFTLNPSISPDHFWASRRWLTYCIPLSILCAAFCLSLFFQRFVMNGKKIPTLVVAGIISMYVAQNGMLTKSFVFTALYKRTPEAFEALVARIRELDVSPVVLVEGSEGEHISSVLTYVYGIPTFTLSDKGRTRVNRREFDDFILAGHFADVRGFDRPSETFPLCATYTEQSVGRPPFGLTHNCKRVVLRHQHLGKVLPTLSIGEPIEISRLSGGVDPLDIGWRQIENWGAWLEGQLGTLSFALPSDSKRRCILRLTGQYFLHERFSSFLVTVKVNDQPPIAMRAQLPLRSFAWEIPIDVGSESDREIIVEIKPQETKSPRELGLSLDGRQLSLGLHSLELQECSGSP